MLSRGSGYLPTVLYMTCGAEEWLVGWLAGWSIGRLAQLYNSLSIGTVLYSLYSTSTIQYLPCSFLYVPSWDLPTYIHICIYCRTCSDSALSSQLSVWPAGSGPVCRTCMTACRKISACVHARLVRPSSLHAL